MLSYLVPLPRPLWMDVASREQLASTRMRIVLQRSQSRPGIVQIQSLMASFIRNREIWMVV